MRVFLVAMAYVSMPARGVDVGSKVVLVVVMVVSSLVCVRASTTWALAANACARLIECPRLAARAYERWAPAWMRAAAAHVLLRATAWLRRRWG